MLKKALKIGDHVSWHSSGGKSEGRIVKVAKKDGQIKDFDYKASAAEPRYIVETEDGEQAAHKADALRKVSRSK